MKSKLLKLVNRLQLNEDVRYNAKSGELNPDYGYLVPITNTKKVDSIDIVDLRSYLRNNKHQVYRPNRYVGIYHHESGYLLTINELVESLNDARLLSSLRKEHFAYDNTNTEIIYFDKAN